MTKRSGDRRQLNPAFASAHGISSKNEAVVAEEEPSSSLQKAKIAVERARESGKLTVANASLSSPLPDVLFDLRQGVEVDLSMNASGTASWELHTEETLTLVDFSDNDLSGILDERVQRYRSLHIFRCKRCGITAIPMSSLKSLEKLTILDLGSNEITSFSIDMLPNSIRELDLSSNKLQSLLLESDNTETSVSLPNLVKLNISHNNLDSISECLDLPRLQSLDCGHNRISTIPARLLDSTSLTTMEAGHNWIATPPDLSKFEQLRIVDLSQNQLTKPPTINVLLSRLTLSQNQLTTLGDLFENDSMTKHSQMVELHVRDNGLERLDGSLVQRLLHVKLLDLRNNNLSSLPSVLGYLPNVRQVLLDGNALRTLGPVDHHDTRALQALLRKRGPAPAGNGYLPQESSSLGGGRSEDAVAVSRDTTTPAGSADMMSSALVGTKILKLEGKELTVIPQALIGQLQRSNVAKRIHVLKLGKNKLKVIDGDLLAALPNLSTLEVDQNYLEGLPSELRILPLSVLSLSRNRLTADSIASSVLGNSLGTAMQKTLTLLDLSSNRLEWLPSDLMELGSLRTVNLSNNRITGLAVDASSSSGWKPGFPALQELMLSDNRITDLGELPLILGASCPVLKTLLLQNNELQMIPPQLGMLESLQTIDLRGNPQRAVRSAILEKGCDAILLFLRNRLTTAQLHDYETKRRAMSEGLAAISKSTTMPATIESVHEPHNESQSLEPANTNDDPSSSSLADELRKEIDTLSLQLNNVHLSEAQKYATKKKLAVQKAKLIREERRLRQENCG